MQLEITHLPVHDRLVPYFCQTCGAPCAKGSDGDNHWYCTMNVRHPRWIQSPHAAYVILLTEKDEIVLEERLIPPAVGQRCSPGGYKSFGEHGRDTIVHETWDEVNIDIHGLPADYLEEWVEMDGLVQVTYYLVRVPNDRIRPFTPNKEVSERSFEDIWTFDENTIPFSANRKAIIMVRERLKSERR